MPRNERKRVFQLNKSGKKLITAAAIGVGVLTETVIHGYFDVMARKNKFNSVIGYFANKAGADNMEDFARFNKSKQQWINNRRSERVTIKSERNEKLVAYITYPDKKSNVFVLFAHGYHADHTGDPANFLQYYVEKGYNFIAVDHTASGESGGIFVGFDYFESNDCLKWIEYIINRFGEDIKIIIHGVSMGGATVCSMVNRVPNQVKLAVADCPYTSALEEFGETARNAGIKKPDALLRLFNELNKLFAGFDLNNTDVRKSVTASKVPMLFVHGGDDTFVPTRMGLELYELCTSPKDIFIVDGAKHAESVRVDENGYHNKLNEFINKYLEG